jgi:hypothetical protein
VTFYLKWLTDKPEFLLCSYRAYAALGPTLFGWLDLYPDPYCEEQWLYGMREL